MVRGRSRVELVCEGPDVVEVFDLVSGGPIFGRGAVRQLGEIGPNECVDTVAAIHAFDVPEVGASGFGRHECQARDGVTGYDHGFAV